VTVDGYAFLKIQADHSGITITFTRTVPSSLTATTTTATDGGFSIDLEDGIYDVTYSKDGYFPKSITDQLFYSNTNLSNITLIEYTTNIVVPYMFQTIQEALNIATDGDTISVYTGTYTENITWPATNGIKLIGSGEDDCIIDGDSLASVIRFGDGFYHTFVDSTTLITGFTIQNGYAHVSSPVTAKYGGGIYLQHSHPTLTNMTFSNNDARDGGGMFISGSSPTLIGVTFSGNTAIHCGGGMYINGTNPTLTGVTFSGNRAVRGGGMCISGTNPTLTGVIFSGNTAIDDGGGIYVLSGNFSMNLSITYSNLYNNDGDNCYNCGELIGNNVTTNANGNSCDAYYNISLDPLFCDPTNEDFSLAETSPLIGAGENGENIGALGIGCTETAVYGCTTTTACNIDADANTDDGSCTYAEENYDCDGNCVNDTDADGICDELEVLGCTVESACNYNADATDNDGSCEYCSCQTCSENGTCVDTGSNYTCTCNSFYTGADCETDIDECATDNGGCGESTCVNNEGTAPTCSELSLFNGLIPEDFNLHSIYPNPFNPVTNIIYGLPEHVNVQILVYDLSGKQVETLISEFKTPGYHSVNWNANNLPSGVYLIRMDSGEFTQTQKVALIK